MKTGITQSHVDPLPVDCPMCENKHIATAIAYLLEYKVGGQVRQYWRAVGEIVLACHEGGQLRHVYKTLLASACDAHINMVITDTVITTLESILESQLEEE